MERRAALAPSVLTVVSIRAARTGTRAVRGKVHARWHDGIEYARDLHRVYLMCVHFVHLYSLFRMALTAQSVSARR